MGNERRGNPLHIEAMQLGPQAAAVELTEVSEVQQLSQAEYIQSLSAEAGAIASAVFEGGWPSAVFVASTLGDARDNPTASDGLTDQQKRRSVMAMFEDVSCFQIRFVVYGCCGTGR